MTINLVQAIQKKLGGPELKKIDPNTQEVKNEENQQGWHTLDQAAIPTVLTALYSYSRSEENAAHILAGDIPGDDLDTILGDLKQDAVEKVAKYSNTTHMAARDRMEQVATAAVTLISQNVPKDAKPHDVKDILTADRKEILSYLPAELQVGELLNDNTLDDRTNKMEGPVSGFMHAIGKLFSGASEEDKEKIERNL